MDASSATNNLNGGNVGPQDAYNMANGIAGPALFVSPDRYRDAYDLPFSKGKRC
jgi:hypothetical protein